MRHIKNYSTAKRLMCEYFKMEEDRMKHDVESAQSKPTALMRKFFLTESFPKEVGVWNARLANADEAPQLVEINIRVKWSKSRIGEFNPHATAYLTFRDNDGTLETVCGDARVSGCGYDKRSEAVCDALSFEIKKRDTVHVRKLKQTALSVLDRFVIEHGESLWKEYAIARSPFPHLCFGGKGMGTFTRLFRNVGFKGGSSPVVNDYLIDYRETGDDDDVYHIIRKGRI